MATLSIILIFANCLSLIFAANCPTGDTSNTGERCVHLEVAQGTWDAAETFCKSKNGHLTSIHNAFDVNIVTGLTSNQPSCNTYWIGLKCSSDSDCQWSDASDNSYHNYAPGQNPKAGCAYADENSGQWSISDCSSTQACFVCETGTMMTDCQDWLKAGYTDNGIYTVIVGNSSVDVYCDMTTYGGGWTLFQSRVDGTFEFWNRTWAEYRDGFGNGIGDAKNYWLGLSTLNQMTIKNSAVTLRVEMTGDGTPGASLPNGFWWNHYDSFQVGSEADGFPLRVYIDWQNPVGNASAGWYDITCENGTVFSTIDKINDPYKDSVLKYQMGGWWLHNGAMSSLNGAYTPIDWNNAYGVFWILNGEDTVIHPRKTRMLFRVASP